MIRITVSTPEIKGLEKEFETNVTAQEVLASLEFQLFLSGFADTALYQGCP